MNNKENLSPEAQEEIQKFKQKATFLFASLLSAIGLVFFLYHTHFINNELLLIILAVVAIYPYKSTNSVKSYLICLAIIFSGWLIVGLGTSVIPFIFAICTSYLLDPVVTKLEKIGLQRWLSSLAVILIASGIIVIISVYFFPILFEQAQTITSQISDYIMNLKVFLTSGEVLTFLHKFGVDDSVARHAMEFDFLPRVEAIASKLFETILKIVLSFSDIGTQIVNVVVMPFLTFYFLKDFPKFKLLLKDFLTDANANIYKHFQRLNDVLRTYISWQFTASMVMVSISSIVYTIFSVPYGILIACISGLLNPIPYFSLIFSTLIAALILLLVHDGYFISNFVVIVSTIAGVHFINAFLLEPNIAGNKVGLHPVLMILSIFIFNSLFGIIGMLVAVPITAVIVMFLRDTYRFHKLQKNNENNNVSDAE
jgi:predicted PurR-regulated permease PerM